MSAKIQNLQIWLNLKGASPQLVEDGLPGPATRRAIIETFRNTNAPAVTAFDIDRIAVRLGCSVRQLAAVAKVESNGGGWDIAGLLKLLWEQHWMFRRVQVVVPLLSDPKPNPANYTTDADRDGLNDSWEKLADASLRWGFGLAAECASFGKFQIMGGHWKALGYPSVAEFVWLLSRTEAAHYDAFGRYIEVNRLMPALRMVDGNPDNCRPISKGYNGSGYERFRYHEKIAQAFRDYP